MGLSDETLKNETGIEELSWGEGAQATGHSSEGRVRPLWQPGKRTNLLRLAWPLDRVFNLALSRAVRRLDAFLRRRLRVEEFVQDEECLLRIGLSTVKRDADLGRQGRVCRGDPLGEVHIWNEHILPMPKGVPDLTWAIGMRRRMARSMAQLAEHIQRDPRFARVKMFRGETAFWSGKPREQAQRVADYFGFELTDGARPNGLWGWLVSIGERIYLWGMIRTFNPCAVKCVRFIRPHWYQLWISREKLIARYGRQKKKCHRKTGGLPAGKPAPCRSGAS